MSNKFDSRSFLASILSAEMSVEAFTARLSSLTAYQQVQVLIRLLSLWRLDEKEQRRSNDKSASSVAQATDDADLSDFDDDNDDFDDYNDPSISDNMRRVLQLISGEGA